MPFINVRTNAALTDEKCESIKSALGQAIALLPGKSERWLMVEVTPECRLWFHGDDSEKMAMVTVAVLGGVSDRDSSALTAKITEILANEAGIPAEWVYVSFSEHDKWGWNGSNF